MPDVLVPTFVSRSYVGHEVRTPAGLLQQRRNPHPLVDSGEQDLSADQNKIEIHEDTAWKSQKSSSDTDSPGEVSSSKLSLLVREVMPLERNESSGKFVFVDQVPNDMVDSSLTEKNLEDRLAHSNGFSFSLDNGLNHIGSKSGSYYKIKDLSSCDDLNLNLNRVSKMLKNLPRGSDPSLLTKGSIDADEEEENLPVFKEQTTELLRSWTEDAPSHYMGVSEISSSERLEEVGVECHESFMCSPVESENVSCPSEYKTEEIVGDSAAEEKTLGSTDTPAESSKKPDASKATEEAKAATDVPKSEKGSENTALSLSDFGITEDAFLNDVASRTAALASQNFSFKMSFSRQSTEDEYH